MALTLLHLLTWAIIAVSFFNTVALLWLGLTVLLNAERRTWATWAAGGGLLLGGVFFIGHSAVVGRNIGTLINELALWWRIGWLPFVGGPYMWYLVIAWYTGVLGAGRHRAWLAAVTALGVAAVTLLAFADPLPSFDALLYERAPAGSSYECCDLTGGIPAALLIYPVYSLLCVVLSLSALRRPEASERFMGDLARRRARPWLVAASLTLLAVALSVGAAAAWVLLQAQAGRLPELSLRAMVLLIGLDLLVSGMIAVVVVLAGQAIVSYEIFTGKTLPRGGLLRHWRRSLILAAGYGAVVGGSLALPLPIDRIWHLLLATALMTLFFALLSWRSYTDRDRSMGQLRLFVASQHLYDSIVSPTKARTADDPAGSRVSGPGAPEDPAAPLRALCEDVLGARLARLLPLGPLASLVEPLAFPEVWKTSVEAAASADGGAPLVPGLSSPELLRSPGVLCLPLDPAASGGAEWAVPLWSERGLIGALLLGPKRDGGLYTQEEIELARTTGERLIDTAASAEMARRLVLLQRQRLAESQVIDRRTRRVLHDDVLPRIHETMLTLQAASGGARVSGGNGETAGGGARPELDQVIGALAAVHKQIADLLHAMPPVAAPEVARSGLIGALRSALEEELDGEFDDVSWQITPEAEAALPQIAPLTAEVAFYAAREVVRNSARHGRAGSDARPLHLKIAAHAGAESLTLRIEDDGVGLRVDTATAGSRRGLELHSTMMAVVGGSLDIQSVPGSFTRATLNLPLAQPGDIHVDQLVITK
jgi:signal transduction histidine kinase